MLTLLQGIQAVWNGNGALLNAGFPGGLEVSVAKDAEALPLCVLTIQPPPPPMFQNAGSASPYAEQITAQFTIYSTDPDEVQAMEALLDAAYNRTSFAIGGDYLVASLRNGGGNPYRDEDAKTWRADYFYKFWVERFS